MSAIDAALQAVVDDLLEQIDSVDGKWTPSWTCATSLPHNALTGASYGGANIILLWFSQMHHRYESNVWATYKQWAQLGGQVRKGETSTHCIKWVVATPKDQEYDDDGKPVKPGRLVPKPFFLFNAAQQDGALIETAEQDVTVPADERMLAFIEPVPFRFINGDPAYAPKIDVVLMPNREDFDTIDDWFGTLVHELAHWTGHESRLAREFGKRFGDEAYAVEELTAELSAAFTCATLGFASPAKRDDHARYIKHWLGVLKREPRTLLTVAQAAQRATNHLLAYSAPAVQESTHVESSAA